MKPDQSWVLISKKWPERKINVRVTDHGISIAMALEEFLASLVEEVGSPAMVFRQETLKQRMVEAAEKVVAEMQQQTTKVM